MSSNGKTMGLSACAGHSLYCDEQAGDHTSVHHSFQGRDKQCDVHKVLGCLVIGAVSWWSPGSSSVLEVCHFHRFRGAKPGAKHSATHGITSLVII